MQSNRRSSATCDRTLAAAEAGGLSGHSPSMIQSSGSGRLGRNANIPNSTPTMRRAGRRTMSPTRTIGRPSTRTAISVSMPNIVARRRGNQI
ncbi:MAG: hypothetical protein M3443_13575 [Actinomycetota bacterium]|nr:hypothetical protein [Actinomycetota bacterium]